MNVMKLAAALIMASLIPNALALDFASAGTQLAPNGWAAIDSSYTAAARQVDLSFPSGASGNVGFSPEEFSATVESGLEERLEARLEQELNTAEAESGKSVSIN